MEINYLQIATAIGGLVLANVSVKALRIYPVLKKAFQLVKDKEEAKADGKITVAEKAKLYDDIVALLKEAWSVAVGFLPNKTKIE